MGQVYRLGTNGYDRQALCCLDDRDGEGRATGVTVVVAQFWFKAKSKRRVDNKTRDHLPSVLAALGIEEQEGLLVVPVEPPPTMMKRPRVPSTK